MPHCVPRPKLSEIAIITIGARWQAEFEWWAHAPMARRVESSYVNAHPLVLDGDATSFGLPP